MEDVTENPQPNENIPSAESQFDIPLEKGEFLFNPGHAQEVLKSGVQGKIWKLDGEEAHWAVVNLTEIDTNNSNQVSVTIDYIGQELRQGGLETNDQIIEDYIEIANNPNTPETKRQLIAKAIEDRKSDNAVMMPQLKVKSESALEFLKKVEPNKDRYERYASTLVDIERVRREIASHT
jgi:hypothetical protein